jgi:glycosyltransferase involved in cell wall biosynthesis
MRIGFDAKRLYNNFTGLGNHSRTTIEILTAEFPEEEYYLYTTKVTDNTVTYPFLHKAHCHTVVPSGAMKGSLWRTLGIVNNLKKDSIELFHGLSNEIPVGISKTEIASVVTIHDVAFKTFPDMYHGLDRIVYDRKWNYACKHADHIIAISECTKNDIIKFYGVPEEKISVLYQPVSPIYYNEGEEEAKEAADKPYMLYVGSINSRKNLLGIVKAMEMLPSDLQIPLVIVGNGGAYKQQVQHYIADHNMEKQFIWKQIIDNRELKKLYAGASLFVYPSFYEGFGLPVVEALLCGCPIVTSNVSSLPEAAGPASIQIDPNDTRAIADGMEKALIDSGLRKRMIEEGRRYAMDSFHPTVLARKLMDIYKVTLGRD